MSENDVWEENLAFYERIQELEQENANYRQLAKLHIQQRENWKTVAKALENEITALTHYTKVKQIEPVHETAYIIKHVGVGLDRVIGFIQTETKNL